MDTLKNRDYKSHNIKIDTKLVAEALKTRLDYICENERRLDPLYLATLRELADKKMTRN